MRALVRKCLRVCLTRSLWPGREKSGRFVQRAKLLVGQLDLNGLIGTFKLDSGESGACPRLNGFLHKKQSIHKSINGGTCPTALLRLSFEI